MNTHSLPEQYIINKFYQYSANVKFHNSSNSYRGCCPCCKEGTSWGIKTRLNYYVNENFLLCYNCNKTWSPLNWIKEISGMSVKEILQESLEYDHVSIINNEIEPKKPKSNQVLPHDSINLFDEIQMKYYADNYVIQDALDLIKTRRLDTAINKCQPLYISLTDYIHKNRLCIPFRDPDNKIRFFQTRALYKRDEDIAKYLSKLNSDKTIYGLNNIDEKLEYLFILEGPIDAFFIKNGVSMAGLKISDHQKELLERYFLYKRIWILDNQLENEEVVEKNLELIEQGETVFVWPKNYKPFKDLNEICCKLKIDKIDPNFIIKNSYEGINAKVNLMLMAKS